MVITHSPDNLPDGNQGNLPGLDNRALANQLTNLVHLKQQHARFTTILGQVESISEERILYPQDRSRLANAIRWERASCGLESQRILKDLSKMKGCLGDELLLQFSPFEQITGKAVTPSTTAELLRPILPNAHLSYSLDRQSLPKDSKPFRVQPELHIPFEDALALLSTEELQALFTKLYTAGEHGILEIRQIPDVPPEAYNDLFSEIHELFPASACLSPSHFVISQGGLYLYVTAHSTISCLGEHNFRSFLEQLQSRVDSGE
ncbi:MAG: hypothetical protein KDD60_11595, partial [Bdellovibrionales bacterium]|nr:hypothetical protein [Bdellovibrionales bacterium]